jgi:hypothetical protein
VIWLSCANSPFDSDQTSFAQREHKSISDEWLRCCSDEHLNSAIGRKKRNCQCNFKENKFVLYTTLLCSVVSFGRDLALSLRFVVDSFLFPDRHPLAFV